MVLCSQRFLVFVEYAGVKDRFDALVDEPLYMAVRQLCGVALGLTRNGFDAHLIDFSGRSRREDNGKSKLSEESKPQWIILVHIQNPRYADDTALSGF